jgi:hypothetical protein
MKLSLFFAKISLFCLCLTKALACTGQFVQANWTKSITDYAKILNKNQGRLTEGKGSVQLTSCTNKFRSAAFEIENIIYFLTK